MEQELITTRTTKIYDFLHHVDLRAYGTSKMLSVYIGEFDDCNILFDCGSSLDTKKLLRYCKNNKLSLKSFKYLITSHHHFDHNGGLHQVYKEIKKYNPKVKILTNQKTKELLNDFESHLNRARRTYGNLVGKMECIEENAFQIIKPSERFSADMNELEILDEFQKNGKKIGLVIFNTPGHTPDHQSPALIEDNTMKFIFWGEAVGTIYHSSKLLTMPTSMPIYYDHDKYMKTLENLKKLKPVKAGFSHFGVVNGESNVREILLEHESFMKEFRERIVKYYSERPETRYVVNKITPFLIKRTDLPVEDNPVFNGIILGIVYGMMIDLGYRKE